MELESLPPEHPARNTPLAGAQYKWLRGGPWKTVEPTFKIAKRTFNELSPAWVDGWTWRSKPDDSVTK